VKDYTVWTKHGEGSAPYTTENDEDERFQFVHGTHQPLPQSEHVVPNVIDHGYCGGSEHDRNHVLPNVMDEEDAELLEAMLASSYRSIDVLQERYGVPEEGNRRAFVR
jgi:hypothetical protein